MISRNRKPRIAILLAHYLPGYRAGGPIRSIANLVQALGDEFEFRIITSDHDLESKVPYSNVIADTWVPVGKAQVIYLSARGRSLPSFLRLLRSLDYEVLYLNSFYARSFSMLPIILQRLHMIPKRPTLLAPRGEFSPGALALKPKRKASYITLAKIMKIYRDVIWQASTELEADDIRRALPNSARGRLTVAGNIPTGSDPARHTSPLTILTASDIAAGSSAHEFLSRDKPSGRLNIVFLSRIARKKNLAAALSFLDGLRGQVYFDIYGPIEDQAYWFECQRTIDQLPANVRVRHCGAIQHDAIMNTLSAYDLFLLPTLGENYGHVIHEALLAGCPVLISNRTPWRNLEALGIGWDLPLEDPEQFRTVLQYCLDMDSATYRPLSQRAYQYGANISSDATILEQNRQMLNHMVALASS